MKKIGLMNEGMIEFGQTRGGEGYCYKNPNEFKAGGFICYIPEQEDLEISIEEIDRIDIFFYEDFIALAGGNEDKARFLFDQVNWNSPYSEIENISQWKDPIINCDNCDWMYDTQDFSECPHCNNPESYKEERALSYQKNGKLYLNRAHNFYFINNFKAKEGVCYISRQNKHLNEISNLNYKEYKALQGLTLEELEPGTSFTYQDFLKAAKGNEDIAKKIFENIINGNCCTLDEYMSRERRKKEYITCSRCGNFYFQGEETKECPICNQVTYRYKKDSRVDLETNKIYLAGFKGHGTFFSKENLRDESGIVYIPPQEELEYNLDEIADKALYAEDFNSKIKGLEDYLDNYQLVDCIVDKLNNGETLKDIQNLFLARPEFNRCSICGTFNDELLNVTCKNCGDETFTDSNKTVLHVGEKGGDCNFNGIVGREIDEIIKDLCTSDLVDFNKNLTYNCIQSLHPTISTFLIEVKLNKTDVKDFISEFGNKYYIEDTGESTFQGC